VADILIVDDEPRIGRLLADDLTDAGHTAHAVTSAAEALTRMESSPPDILITDLRMDGMDGHELLRETRRRFPGVDVLIMTAYASLETALATMRDGASDYIIKPFRRDDALLVVSRIESRRRLEAENRGLRGALARGLTDELVGSSPAMAGVRKLIEGLATADSSVLIRGESGTGKEVVARVLHRTSRRAGGPFIAINCAAIPETLLESELFGYEKGAFTGAVRAKAGLFQLAHGGTLFLDEIGDLPASLQAKLLRVLESRSVTPLGGVKHVQVDIRIISATHRALEEDIATGAFRQDLFYRLNVFPVVLPPLRERRGDVAELARHFLAEWGRPPADLGDDAMARLAAADWPGNARELRNVLERAVVMRPTGRIGADDIVIGHTSRARADSSITTLNLEEAEKDLIRRALEATGGNKSEAARLLGITRRALYGRLERYGMETD